MTDDKLYLEIMDISKTLNKTNLENRKNALMYHNLFDDIPVMLFTTGSLISPNKNTSINFINANKKALDVLGYTLEEITSCPFIDFIHPDDISSTKDIIIDLNIVDNEGMSISGFINRYRKKDGDYVYLRWLDPIKTSMGEIHVTENVTDLINLQKEFINSNLMLNSIPSFLLMTNINGDIYLSNKVSSKISGFSEFDLRNKNINNILEIKEKIIDKENNSYGYLSGLDLLEVICNGINLIIVKDDIISSKGELIGHSYVGHIRELIKSMMGLFDLEPDTES